MSKIDILTAYVKQLLSNAKVTFSQGDAIDRPKKVLAPGLRVRVRKVKKN